MVMKPKPSIIECSSCHTKEFFAPDRDVIPFFPRCKNCGGEMKIVRSANLLENQVIQLRKTVEKFFNKRKPF